MLRMTIPGRLPGTNEMIAAANANRHVYAAMKREYTEMVAWIAKQLPVLKSVALSIAWYEPNEKRDIDNVAGGTKFILDGLVMSGRLQNDTRRYVRSIEHRFGLDRNNPRIEVEIMEVE